MQNSDFTKIFEEYKDQIYRYIYVRTYDKEIAEDVTSETFLRMLKQENFDPKLAKYWLIKVSRNILYDKYRSAKNRLETGDESDIDSEIAEKIDIESQVASTELIAKVKNHLNELPEDNREVISLRLWEEMQFSEIADILGEKESTVKLRYYRGLEKLKVIVEESGYDTAGLKIGAIVAAFVSVGSSAMFSAPAAVTTTVTAGGTAVSTGLASGQAMVGIGLGVAIVAVTGLVLATNPNFASNPATVTTESSSSSQTSSSTSTETSTSSASSSSQTQTSQSQASTTLSTVSSSVSSSSSAASSSSTVSTSPYAAYYNANTESRLCSIYLEAENNENFNPAIQFGDEIVALNLVPPGEVDRQVDWQGIILQYGQNVYFSTVEGANPNVSLEYWLGAYPNYERKWLIQNNVIYRLHNGTQANCN